MAIGDFPEGATATHKDGRQIVFRNGEWHLAKQASTSGSGKPLPDGAAKRLEDQVSTYSSLKSALGGFKDEFAGNTLTGDLENQVQSYTGLGSEGQRDWWAQFRATDNLIRNQLFGAALSVGEQRAYEATTIKPSMDPAEVRRNLSRREQIVREALGRRTNYLKVNGYKPEAVDALLGEYGSDLSGTPQQAKGGDQQSGTAGALADGSGTPPSGPGGTPPTPPPGTEAKFGDEMPQQMQSVAELTPEQQAAIQAVAQSGGSAEQIVAVARQFGRNVSAENAAALAKFYADPKNRGVTPTVQDDRAVKPIDAGDGAAGAAARGAGNTLSVGLLDEAGALADTVSQGGTYAENLDRRRGQELFDEQNHGFARGVGQLVGAIPLGGVEVVAPRAAAQVAFREALAAGETPAAARAIANRTLATRSAINASAQGGAYGFGDTDGGLGERLGGAAVAAGAAGVLGGAGAYGGSRFSRYLAQRTRGAGAPVATEQQAALQAAERQNIVPFPADVGGAGVRRLTGAVSQTMAGAGPIRAGAQATLDSAEAVRNRVAASIGDAVNPEAAGEAARTGAQAFIARTGQRIGRIYDAATAAAGQARVDTPEALRVLNQELPALAESPVQGPGVGILQNLQEALQQPQTVRGLRNMRTLIRDEFENAGLRGSNVERIANRVVDAATDDIVSGLRAQGLDRAATQYRVADRMWRDRLATIDEHLAPILGDDTGPRAKSGEQVLSALQAAMQGNNRRFAGFIQALPPHEQGTVRASLIQRLGRATAGNQDQGGEVFSLATFLSHWDKIGERAKNTLFGQEGRAALNDLATYANQSKQSQRFANHSNTAGAVSNLSAIWNFSTLGAALAAENLGGRLLASPRFARWLARPPRQSSPAAAQQWVGRLERIARAEPAIASDVLSLQQRLADAFGTSPTRLAAEEGNSRDTAVQGQNGQAGRTNQGLQP